MYGIVAPDGTETLPEPITTYSQDNLLKNIVKSW